MGFSRVASFVILILLLRYFVCFVLNLPLEVRTQVGTVDVPWLESRVGD